MDTKLFLDESLRYYFDYDWIIRLLQKTNVFYLNEVIAFFRYHQNSKTVSEKFLWIAELEIVIKRYWNSISKEEKNQIQAYFELNKAANHLGVKQWNRKIAQEKLKNSFQIYPKILFSIIFLEFLIRSIIPFSFIKFFQSLFLN